MEEFPKKRKLDQRPFQENWTNEYGFVEQHDRAVCVFCCESVVYRTSSVQGHFQTNINLSLKPQKRKVKPSKKLFLIKKNKLVF